MTYQRDPSERGRSTSNRTWGTGSVLTGLALLGLIAFLIFSFTGDRMGDAVTPRSPGATSPTTATPPASTPPTTTPKQ